MPSPTSSSSSTIVLSSPPKGSCSPRHDGGREAFPTLPSSLRASSREAGIVRNRRRSLSHIALLDEQIQSHQQTRQQQSPLATSAGGAGAGLGLGSASGSAAAVAAARIHSRSSSISSSSAAALADTLLPTLSPHAEERSEAFSPDKLYLPGQPKSLAGIALRAFGLGIALAVGCVATAVVLFATSSPLWRLPFFLTALATFHFLEFWTTAAYNTREAEVSSFLLTANWPAYAIAHSVASLECLVVNVLFPDRQWAPVPHLGTLSMLVGLALVVVGQVVRSVAMIQAGPSFNHIVQQTQKQEHILVTTGIYGSLRHPSYFGFFWWGLGTQLVMGNLVCFVGYAAVLWRFFSSRIRHEEVFLVKFFGGEYLDYRKKVGTKIPFVP
ncbi:farnesyl cysteine-carboxyl methyltransferase [Gnomoniopsis sp. IMI 355080]|nr:farnesyl cysteine-carboxyl methyltransferase [Gnomoniopsis sp. IMI 355080]